MSAVANRNPSTLESLPVSDGYARLGRPFVTHVEPTPLPEPYPIAFNTDAAELLGLANSEAPRLEFVRVAAGCARFAQVRPFAAVYDGHQFGTYAGQLGDGRAITLGEVTAADGTALEWQIKGAGVTPYSRFGDGRAVLRSTIREYLCSEAMAALGIPTTRALAIVGSAEPVYRETPETAAVLTRLAPSHLRFGTFEHFHYRGEFEHLKTLADYTIDRFFPQVATIPDERERYVAFLREVVTRTANLMARWQAVGFAHGVMNTDNMSILGLTLDYGPFGFLDAYDPGFICNHTDVGGRYAFDKQPTIGLWNCYALAAALGSLVDGADAKSALDAYEPTYRAAYLELVRAKFGITVPRDEDVTLILDAFALMRDDRIDYTSFFRGLSRVSSAAAAPVDEVLRTEAASETWAPWFERYWARLSHEPLDDKMRRSAMEAVNPKFVLRNHIAQRAIERATEGDYTEIARVHETLRRPFDEWPDRENYAAGPAPGEPVVCVSCSS